MQAPAKEALAASDSMRLLLLTAGVLSGACSMELRSVLLAAAQAAQRADVAAALEEIRDSSATLRTLGHLLRPRLDGGSVEASVADAMATQSANVSALARELEAALQPLSADHTVRGCHMHGVHARMCECNRCLLLRVACTVMHEASTSRVIIIRPWPLRSSCVLCWTAALFSECEGSVCTCVWNIRSQLGLFAAAGRSALTRGRGLQVGHASAARIPDAAAPQRLHTPQHGLGAPSPPFALGAPPTLRTAAGAQPQPAAPATAIAAVGAPGAPLGGGAATGAAPLGRHGRAHEPPASQWMVLRSIDETEEAGLMSEGDALSFAESDAWRPVHKPVGLLPRPVWRVEEDPAAAEPVRADVSRAAGVEGVPVAAAVEGGEKVAGAVAVVPPVPTHLCNVLEVVARALVPVQKLCEAVGVELVMLSSALAAHVDVVVGRRRTATAGRGHVRHEAVLMRVADADSAQRAISHALDSAVQRASADGRVLVGVEQDGGAGGAPARVRVTIADSGVGEWADAWEAGAAAQSAQAAMQRLGEGKAAGGGGTALWLAERFVLAGGGALRVGRWRHADAEYVRTVLTFRGA